MWTAAAVDSDLLSDKYHSRVTVTMMRLRVVFAGVVGFVLGALTLSLSSGGGASDFSSFGTMLMPTLLASSRSTPLTCRWGFVKYHRSAMEQKWWDNVNTVQDAVCETTLKLEDDVTAWIDFTSRHIFPNATNGGVNCSATAGARPTWPLPTHVLANETRRNLVPGVLSTFEYSWRCSDSAGEAVDVSGAAVPNVHVPIDPLAGPLRDPRICKDHGLYEPSKEYLLVDPWYVHNVGPAFSVKAGDHSLAVSDHASLPLATPQRFFIFDVGASTWSSGAGGPSQPFFTGVIEDRCGHIDGFYAWEATTEDPGYVHRCRVRSRQLPVDDAAIEHCLHRREEGAVGVLACCLPRSRVACLCCKGGQIVSCARSTPLLSPLSPRRHGAAPASPWHTNPLCTVAVRWRRALCTNAAAPLSAGLWRAVNLPNLPLSR